jgi:hypothetical protein
LPWYLYSSGNKALIPKNVLLPFVVHLFAHAYRAPHSCAVSGLFKNLWMYSMHARAACNICFVMREEKLKIKIFK